MSLVAPRTVTPSAEDVPDVDDGGEKVTAGEFWPEIVLSNVRKEMRITGAVTTSRLKQVVIEAVAHTSDQLKQWQAEQIGAGYASLAAVPAMVINDESVKVYRWRRAVYSIARALLIETFRDVDTTGDAGEKRAAALATQANDHWRDARWAISDIQGVVRNSAEAF
ncbi:head completion/stabilization protein [Escherichia coli]|uniref:head completion/stabilization protein n=1 Tax=Enterobacteriaceae TaxID=543 RepID=UPI000A3C3AB8|nr:MULTISPECIES: head completion/stabilization protein [Enterobacteriaceae]DAI71964.1 MAG TPA: head completion protein [Caudoviricetes sp.]EJB5576294.1 head completion/stabilization protein [Citrobacter freundii]MBJ8696311.1 head completion/stabilization protein [Citrobacter freundii]MCZ9402096.1 head completion/stabilization protein [Escherichia coli]MDU2486080.1 head completion/stabilization protein [Citrobacter freundii]